MVSTNSYQLTKLLETKEMRLRKAMEEVIKHSVQDKLKTTLFLEVGLICETNDQQISFF